MIKKIENAFKDLIYTLHMARLYGPRHSKFIASIDKTFEDLQDIFKERDNIIVGFIGEELAFEREIFFELSKIAKPITDQLKEIEIEKIVIHRNVTKEELIKFVTFILNSKKESYKAPQEYLGSIGVSNITVSKIGVPPEASKDDLEIDYLALYNDALAKFSKTIDVVLNNQDMDYLNLKLVMGNMLDILSGQYQQLLKLATIKRYDSRTFTHILNVAILSMHFASKLGFCKDDTMEIGVAALFHDVGKLYISRKIITKPSKLTDEEFAKMKSHVVLGAEILLKYVDKIGVLPIVVAFQHHLRFDLNGYPKLFISAKPNPVSLIVAICDVYDALSQRRSYKSDYPPGIIYGIMMKDRGSAFEPKLLDDFFRIMGVWPIGSLLCLNDKSICVVRQENPEDIFSPKVEVIAPENKRAMLDLKKLKGKIEIERYLNPFTEGKDYIKYI